MSISWRFITDLREIRFYTFQINNKFINNYQNKTDQRKWIIFNLPNP